MTFQIINKNDQHVLFGKEGQYFIYKEIQHSVYVKEEENIAGLKNSAHGFQMVPILGL